MAILLPQELRPKSSARATRKERMYIGYYFKDGLGQNRRPVLPGEEPNAGGLRADPRHQQPTGEAGGHSREALLRGEELNFTLR
jgi:hypothetical protein